MEIIVLDYAIGEVFIYKNLTISGDEALEDFVASKHSLENVEWMSAKELQLNIE